jgi:hypothetical protein
MCHSWYSLNHCSPLRALRAALISFRYMLDQTHSWYCEILLMYLVFCEKRLLTLNSVSQNTHQLLEIQAKYNTNTLLHIIKNLPCRSSYTKYDLRFSWW